MPLVFGPPALSHINANRFVRIDNSLVVAMSPNYDCGGDDDVSIAMVVIIAYTYSKMSKNIGVIKL